MTTDVYRLGYDTGFHNGRVTERRQTSTTLALIKAMQCDASGLVSIGAVMEEFAKYEATHALSMAPSTPEVPVPQFTARIDNYDALVAQHAHLQEGAARERQRIAGWLLKRAHNSPDLPRSELIRCAELVLEGRDPALTSGEQSAVEAEREKITRGLSRLALSLGLNPADEREGKMRDKLLQATLAILAGDPL